MTLALFGGRPVRTRPFPVFSTIGEEEKKLVLEVLDGGVLSGFAARPGREFYGGPKVLELETEFRQVFGMQYAVALNSGTSALHACVAAAGIGPGDEVITTPYTMSASATCILMQGAIPVFADIEPDMFCVNPHEIERLISPRTKAILVVNLFGQPAALDPILALARRHGLILIEDNAQAPGAQYHRRHAGTIGHLGVFSLNRHKTIQCGEGGVAVTNDQVFAHRLQLIRNHGEVLAEDLGWPDERHVLGYNYRMTELQAAVALAQMRKLHRLNEHRVALAAHLTGKLSGCDYLIPPQVRDGCSHVYYLYAMRFRSEALGVSRVTFIKALQSEGVPVQAGYVKPLYHLPVFQRLAGTSVTCRVAESLYRDELITTNVCRYPATTQDMDDVVRAIEKIGAHRAELARHEHQTLDTAGAVPTRKR